MIVGMYTSRSAPFCYFAINDSRVKWVMAGDEHLAMLPSGVEATLVGRR